MSGSLNLGSSSPASIDSRYTSGSTDGRSMAVGQGYGVFYPDQGIILLNPEAIESEIGFSCHTGSTSAPSGSEDTTRFSVTGSDFTGSNADAAHHWIYAAIKNGVLISTKKN